jgi:protoporphyrinogen oxidase
MQKDSSSDTTQHMKTAIIVGAGPAGLTAAYELLTRSNIIPVIFEADDQVGGLSKTVNYKNNRIDLGGHRFFSKSDEIIERWLHFLSLENSDQTSPINIQYQNKVKTFTPHLSHHVVSAAPDMLIRKRKSRIYYKKHFFDYPLQLSISTIRKLGFRKMLRIGFSFGKAKLFPHTPEATLADFFTNRFGKELYETFFKDYTEKVWGVKCNDLPASWGYQRVKDLNIGKAIRQAFKSIFSSNTSINQKGTSTSLIEQFLYPKYGPGQMWETVAAEIKRLGGQIHLNTEVVSLQADECNHIKSIEVRDKRSGATQKQSADLFISTMPIQQLINGLQHPFPNATIQQLAGGLAYREFIIAGLLIKKPIADSSDNGNPLKDNWIYLQDSTIKAGRLQIFNNWSPFMVNDPATMWIGVEFFCSAHDAFWNKTEAEIAQIAIYEMESIGFIKKGDVLDSTVIKVEKAYPSYTGTYERFNEIKDYLDTFPNLYLIGRNGMHRYNNTDHSMMTAIQTVTNIVNGVESREEIWNINMEEDYHEEK